MEQRHGRTEPPRDPLKAPPAGARAVAGSAPEGRRRRRSVAAWWAWFRLGGVPADERGQDGAAKSDGAGTAKFTTRWV
ncbi:hypothetical protein [Actinomadura verrucosospora]|uniref:hypothetical protein n=1 Tax=Actinomadura verrucosospora TaxID=46165 RepID=UPI00156353C2|nr:hypothetical protein [Actinomadura verrucosospora]